MQLPFDFGSFDVVAGFGFVADYMACHFGIVARAFDFHLESYFETGSDWASYFGIDWVACFGIGCLATDFASDVVRYWAIHTHSDLDSGAEDLFGAVAAVVVVAAAVVVAAIVVVAVAVAAVVAVAVVGSAR